MKAYVYHGPDQKGAWEEVPNPTILEPTDVYRPCRHHHHLRY